MEIAGKCVDGKFKQWKVLEPCENLLETSATYFLKDACRFLPISSSHVMQIAETIDIGVFQACLGEKDVWLLEMKVFRPWLYSIWNPEEGLGRIRVAVQGKDYWRISTVPNDPNVMLFKPGIFLLHEVCQNIPFTAEQLRYQYRTHGEVTGLFVAHLGKPSVYLVNMSVFGPWLIDIWKRKKLP